MHEISKNNEFLFVNFLEGLTGEITSRISSEINDHLNKGRLQVVFNPAVQVSQVSQYDDGSIVLFLPNDYSQHDAMIEYPRILPEILKYSRGSDNNVQELGRIEEKIREEAQNQ